MNSTPIMPFQHNEKAASHRILRHDIFHSSPYSTEEMPRSFFPMELHASSRLLPRWGLLPRCSSFAFTLIELLVVVAIIGILAALLTPAIITAMQKGNQARCVGNLRSIGAAAGAWSAANNNQVLFQQEGNSGNTNGWTGFWMEKILDSTTNALSNRLFRCPSDKSYGIGDKKSYACSSSTYNANTRQGFVYPAVLEASKKIIVIDSVVGGGCVIREAEFYSTDVNVSAKISFRHFGRANALFADGHVETLPSVKDAPPPALALPWQQDHTLAAKWMNPSIPGN
jgi:prepilin-type N-terminal cleavage/methylation domain-containing protein/prepilin-type processing-associated H-X9-DG protein